MWVLVILVILSVVFVVRLVFVFVCIDVVGRCDGELVDDEKIVDCVVLMV